MKDIDELLRSNGDEWRASQPPSAVKPDPADFPASVRSRVELNRVAVGTAGVVGAIGLALLMAVVWLQRPTSPNIGQSSLPPSPTTATSTAAAECYRGEYQVMPTANHQATPDDLSTIRTIIEHRIASLGVSGAIVQTQGSDRIVVQLPCISNAQDVRQVVGATGRLDFVPIPRTMTGVDRGTTLGTTLPPCPDNLADLANPCVLFSGDQVASASVVVDSTIGQPVLNFTLKSDGAALFDKFAAVAFAGTDQVSNEQFAIVLDGTVVTAPTVNARSFGGQGQIAGPFTSAQLNDLATMLKYGALPLAIQEVSFTQSSSNPPASPSQQPEPTTTPFTASPTLAWVVDQSIGISFERPSNWTRWQPNEHNPMTEGPLIYLSTDPLKPDCAVAPSATPHPPDAGGYACTWPLAALAPNGVLVTWLTTRIVQPLPTAGEAVNVNGTTARLQIDKPGGCAAVGADETLELLVPIGQPTPLSNIAMVACLRGPDLATSEAQVRAMLASATVTF